MKRETRNRHLFGVKAKMPPSTCATSSTLPWRLCRTDANDMIFSTDTRSPCCRCLTRTLTKSWGANQCRGHGKYLERPDLETGSQMSLTEFIGSEFAHRVTIVGTRVSKLMPFSDENCRLGWFSCSCRTLQLGCTWSRTWLVGVVWMLRTATGSCRKRVPDLAWPWICWKHNQGHWMTSEGLWSCHFHLDNNWQLARSKECQRLRPSSWWCWWGASFESPLWKADGLLLTAPWVFWPHWLASPASSCLEFRWELNASI